VEHVTLADISEMLGVPRSTVDSMALSIYRKLGVSPLSDVLNLADLPSDP
jgi:DNA-binding NarL/FixJ family response regulator